MSLKPQRGEVCGSSKQFRKESIHGIPTRYVAMRTGSVNVVSWLYAHSGQMEGTVERRDT